MTRELSHFCIIIPCYEEHSKQLSSTLSKVSASKLDVIVIDDGSSKENAKIISETCLELGATLIKNESNLGKGGAVKAGIMAAFKGGYSHAIQVDSDGQHDVELLSKFIEESKKHPHSLISGRPIFDENVPKKRLYGRYFTHMWVWIETLSFHIKDTMCGFRSYPVVKTKKLIETSFLETTWISILKSWLSFTGVE